MEDLAGRRKTLERERLRLEKLLSQHPQWRMMRAAGELPERVDGVWQFPGLNRVQASALRESLIFRAYQDVLDGLAKLDERREGSRVQADASAASKALRALEAGPAGSLGSASRASAPVTSDTNGRENDPVSSPGPAFRTRVKIKPVVRAASPEGNDAPAQILVEPPAVTAAPERGSDEAEISQEAADQAAAPSDELPPRVQPSAVEDRAASADDLTRIRSINRALAARLTDAGISSFAQIAAWNGDEVRRVARDMELDQRIWREGWIEQAAALILKAGGTLPEIARGAPAADVTSRVAAVQPDDRGGDGKAETPVVVAPAVNESVASAPVQSATSVVTQKQQPAASAVAGVVPVTLAMPIARLAGRSHAQPVDGDGAGRSADKASVPTEPKSAVDARPGEAGAAGAAKAQTANGRVEADDMPSPVPEPVLEPAKPEQPARALRTHKVGRKAQRLPAPSVRRFTYIYGLSDEMAERLRASGVRSLNEIAAWRAADVEWFQAILGDEARISGDQWIEQAALLANGRWTAYALRLVQGSVPEVVARPAPLVARREPKTAFAARFGDATLAAYGQIGKASVVPAEDKDAPADMTAAQPGAAEAVAAASASEVSADEVAAAETAGALAATPQPEPRDAPSSEVTGEVSPREVARPVDTATPEVAVAAPVVVPFVPAKKSEAPVAAEAPPLPEVVPDAVSEPVRETEPADQQDEIKDAPPAAEPASGETRDRLPGARPPASLFADDLVEQLTHRPDGGSRRLPVDEPAIESRDVQPTLPDAVEAEPAVVAEGREVRRWPDVDDRARDDVAAFANDAFDAAGADEFAAPDGEWVDDGQVASVRSADDVADAEALVIRRSPARDAEPVGVTPKFEAGRSAAFDARGAEDAASWNEEIVDQGQAGDEVGAQGFAPLGEEASVRIVSRRAERTQSGHDEQSGETARHGEHSDEPTEGGDPDSPESGTRQRLGFSPEFLARRMLQRDDEAEDDYAGYRDEVEEASVTIIRAKGQATPESSVVPERIANDQSDVGADARPDQAGSGTLKKRGLGSRFLKALTGD